MCLTMLDLDVIYCFIDDFCKDFMPQWEHHLIETGLKKRNKHSTMSWSEIMTIMILFHSSDYRTFKHFYIDHVCKHMQDAFPDRVSYNRFVELKKSALVPLYFLMQMLRGEQTGIYFIDSTPIKVCHIKREKQNKVFKGLAKKSSSTTGWFFGFKLHIVINDKGEIMAFKVTEATTDDRVPVDYLTQGLIGKLIGDKGYIKKVLSQDLLERGLQLITRTKKKMKNSLITLLDKALLRKRAIIESVNDQLKNISQIEHTRHRSVWNFMTNILCGLIAYSFQPKKPNLRSNQCSELIVL